jgi:hypothetical protein
VALPATFDHYHATAASAVDRRARTGRRWTGPYRNGWEVAAQDTARRTRPWVLTAQVVCLKPVRDETSPGGALPAETTGG